jgi:glycosyltransferase involved in cell wall biosynthesis
MAAGVPVVATRVGGVAEMVIDANNGYLYEVGDVDALTRVLQSLLQCPDLREKLGSLGKQRARTVYHPSEVANRTLEVYRALQETAHAH